MKRFLKLLAVATSYLLIACTQAGEHHHNHSVKKDSPAKYSRPERLPQLPPGVEGIKFGEFFETPVDSGGLIPSKKLKKLEGKKVRILGFMVEQEEFARDYFLLAPIPLSLDEEHFSNDLPTASLLVKFTPSAKKALKFTPEPLLLTGTLRLGNAEERDGRISHVRLYLDPARTLSPRGALQTYKSPKQKN